MRRVASAQDDSYGDAWRQREVLCEVYWRFHFVFDAASSRSILRLAKKATVPTTARKRREEKDKKDSHSDGIAVLEILKPSRNGMTATHGRCPDYRFGNWNPGVGPLDVVTGFGDSGAGMAGAVGAGEGFAVKVEGIGAGAIGTTAVGGGGVSSGLSATAGFGASAGASVVPPPGVATARVGLAGRAGAATAGGVDCQSYVNVISATRKPMATSMATNEQTTIPK
jgi:hypothetical protein